MPAPIRLRIALGLHVLPEHGKSQRTNTQLGNAIDVAQVQHVPRTGHLIEELIADAIHRAFDAAPHFERPSSGQIASMF
jgi:hypothetical protein